MPAARFQHALQLLLSRRARIDEARTQASSRSCSRTSCRRRRRCSQRIARAVRSACGPAGRRLEVTADFTPDAALDARDVRIHCRRGGRRAALGRLRQGRSRSIASRALRRCDSETFIASRLAILRSSLQHESVHGRSDRGDLEIARWPNGEHSTDGSGNTAAIPPEKSDSLSDAATLEHIEAVFAGNARSLLDFPDRPAAYDDAGHGIDWNRRRMRHWSTIEL